MISLKCVPYMQIVEKRINQFCFKETQVSFHQFVCHPISTPSFDNLQIYSSTDLGAKIDQSVISPYKHL